MSSYHCCGTGERRIRLLIADDAPRSRAGLRALLATLRLSAPDEAWPQVEVVAEAGDGQQAVRLVEEYRPDAVLMDARMPVMDGLEATRLIKKRWPTVRVVVLTMYPTYRAGALAAGADAFLVKGCPAEKLFEAMMDD